jgi:hypothetical protein
MRRYLAREKAGFYRGALVDAAFYGRIRLDPDHGPTMWQFFGGRILNVHNVDFADLVIHGEIIKTRVHLDDAISGAAEIAQQLYRSGFAFSGGQLVDEGMRTMLGVSHVPSRNDSKLPLDIGCQAPCPALTILRNSRAWGPMTTRTCVNISGPAGR